MVRHAAFHELVVHLGHHIQLFLSHCLAEGVRLAWCESGQLPRKQHDLFLVDRYAVSVLQDLFHFRYGVFYLFDALLPVDEIRYVIHRTGTVQRIHRYQVLEPAWMQLAEPFLHSVGFELEHCSGVRLAE